VGGHNPLKSETGHGLYPGRRRRRRRRSRRRRRRRRRVVNLGTGKTAND
jgi:hypothetical protein